METETNPLQISLKWFEIWRIAFLHPSIKTFSRIINDPKASTKWGMLWMAITALMIWFFGPQRAILWGMAADQIGLQAASTFMVIGAIAAPILGVSALLILAAIAHGLARLFNGAGTFHQLVSCWGIMQLPFILCSGLAYYLLQYISSIIRLLFPGEFTWSTYGIISIISMLIAMAVILYLFYAEVVAFSAVEKFGIGKGLGILILFAIVVGVASACLSFGVQAIAMKLLRY